MVDGLLLDRDLEDREGSLARDGKDGKRGKREMPKRPLWAVPTREEDDDEDDWCPMAEVAVALEEAAPELAPLAVDEAAAEAGPRVAVERASESEVVRTPRARELEVDFVAPLMLVALEEEEASEAPWPML